MRRRWSALAVVAAVAVTPLLAACGDDDDDAPSDPTVTLFEGTINPNVSTDASRRTSRNSALAARRRRISSFSSVEAARPLPGRGA
jgi:hypothetical protein